MEAIVRVTAKELARNPQRVFQAVRRGMTAMVERNGEPTAAIVDIIDYRVLRAVARARTNPIGVIAPERGLPNEMLARETDAQARYDLVLAYYLTEEISLGRAAELLDVPWAELRERFLRVGVPLRLGPATIEELREEIESARAISTALAMK